MADHPVHIIGKGNWLELVRDGKWEYVRRNRGTAVVAITAITDAGEIVLVEQFRPAVRAMCLELPAGIVGDEQAFSAEDTFSAAQRELEEGTGFQARTWEHLFDGASSTGLTTEITRMYRATGLTQISAGGGDASENILVHLVPLQEARPWLADQQAQGKIIDIKVWTAVNS